MRHLKIYEKFVETSNRPMDTGEDQIDMDMDTGEQMDMDMDTGEDQMDMNPSNFQVETTKFTPTQDDEEGDYIVSFNNSDGEETTMAIGHSVDPEYVGGSMISSIEMVPDSSSDGREYSIVGYYDEIPGSEGAYELKKVLIEG